MPINCLPDSPLLYTDSRVRRTFLLLTNGEDAELDALGIAVEVFNKLSTAQRRALLSYLHERYIDDVQSA